MTFIIYKITNVINGKIYVGYHSTNNIDDGYMGSGKILLIAIKKYGKENFKKEILYFFLTKEDALLKEAEIVNDDFVNDINTYNIKRGGEGGFDYINNLFKTDPIFKQNACNKMSDTLKKLYKLGILNSTGMNNGNYGKRAWNKNKSLTEEHKLNISKNNGMKLSSNLIKSRINDYNEIEKSRGWNTKLAIKWNVSHTQVNRFVKKFC